MPLGCRACSPPRSRRSSNTRCCYTGLTYCGHPLSVRAGVAAVRAYADAGADRASRADSGRSCSRMLRQLQARHPVIGDVRGGHGLFAVLELVRDRATREPLSPWPQEHPALRRLVQRGRRAGRLLRRTRQPVAAGPPLVIAENELGDALALLDRLLGRTGTGHEFQADLRDDVQPAGGRCTSASRRQRPPRAQALGAAHALYIDGRTSWRAQNFVKINPGRMAARSAASRPPMRPRSPRPWRPRSAAFPAWRATPVAERVRLMKAVAALIEERVYDIAAALCLEVGKNRMEGLGRGAGGGGLLPHLCAMSSSAATATRAPCADDPLTELPLAQPQRAQAPRRVGGDRAVQLPARTAVGARRRGPGHRQHRGGQGRDRYALGGTPAGRLHPRCGLPPGVFNYLTGTGSRPARRSCRHPDLAGITFTGSHAVGMHICRCMVQRAVPAPVHRGDGRQECRHRDARTRTLSAPCRESCAPPSACAGRNARRCRESMWRHPVADALIERLQAGDRRDPIGDPAGRENWLGPVISRAGCEKFAGYCAQLRTGGGAHPRRRRALRDGTSVQGTLRATRRLPRHPRVIRCCRGDVPAHPHAAPGPGPAIAPCSWPTTPRSA